MTLGLEGRHKHESILGIQRNYPTCILVDAAPCILFWFRGKSWSSTLFHVNSSVTCTFGTLHKWCIGVSVNIVDTWMWHAMPSP